VRRNVARDFAGSQPVEALVVELKTGLGLDHFEGRSFAGWHRHVALAVLAQAFCTKLRTDPKAPAPG
jgi:SRSO17 transposase